MRGDSTVTLKIGFIAFNGVEELDLVGPWEVFQSAHAIDSDFDCEIISLDGNYVDAAKGMRLGVHAVMKADSRYDVLLLPGGKGVLALIKNNEFLSCLMEIVKKSTWVTSVCTGSLVYARMGLLDGRQCTTHRACIDQLQEIMNGGNIIRDKRYIRDGKFVTAAGISAGIDMSLWLLGQLKNPQFAKQVQEYMEYFPEPPYSDDPKE